MRHYRLTYGDALRAHTLAIESSGGRAGILCNHGFVDGNKRTSALLLFLLLERSGYALSAAPPGEVIDLALEELIVGVADRRTLRTEVEAWLAARCRRVLP